MGSTPPLLLLKFPLQFFSVMNCSDIREKKLVLANLLLAMAFATVIESKLEKSHVLNSVWMKQMMSSLLKFD